MTLPPFLVARRYLFAWCLTALALLTSGLSCTARERFTPGGDEAEDTGFGLNTETGYVAVFDLSRGAPEQAGGGLFQMPASRTFSGLVQAISKTLEDDDAKSVFVRLSQQNYSWAQTEEAGRLLHKLRKADKSVICHAHTLTNSTAWLLLKSCDQVWLSPAGEVSTVGIAAQMTYFKGAMDKLNIQADFLSMGRFKSGGEPMTQEGPSEASRRNLTDTLRSIRSTWLKGASHAREQTQGLGEALENGPFVPSVAKAKGLVDAVGFESDALEQAKQRGKVKRKKTVFGPGRQEDSGGVAELVRVLTGTDGQDTARDHIAIVPAVGSITMASSEGFGSDGIVAAPMLKTLRRLRKSKSVKAVVLRMDSPGGSPLASDLIWKEMMELRKEKPVITSVGGMAASGGYYIACASDKILAERTSIVGSIGVFGGKFVISGALDDVGITSFTFPASPEPGAAARAAFNSPLTAWDDATRSRVKDHMQHIYDLFLERVAKGRRIPVAKVKQHAEGAIFSGAQGKQHGLVDQLGGLSDAIRLARQKASLPDDAPISIEGMQDGLLDSLFGGPEPAAEDAEAALAQYRARQQQWQALIPQNLRVFFSSLLPLTQGERSLVALPYALEIQ